MTIKWQDAALLLVAAFLLGWLLSHGSSTGVSTIQEKEIVREHFDTAHSVVYVPFRPLEIKSTTNHTRTITLHDTIYREACLDTLIASDTAATAPDTLSVCYARDSFSVAVGFSPRRKDVAVPYIAHDTFYWHEHSPPQYEGDRKWYDDALIVILSLAAGIIVGKL
jgi:hypothetical protein